MGCIYLLISLFSGLYEALLALLAMIFAGSYSGNYMYGTGRGLSSSREPIRGHLVVPRPLTILGIGTCRQHRNMEMMSENGV